MNTTTGLLDTTAEAKQAGLLEARAFVVLGDDHNRRTLNSRRSLRVRSGTREGV
jgi:hypothetical protein